MSLFSRSHFKIKMHIYFDICFRIAKGSKHRCVLVGNCVLNIVCCLRNQPVCLLYLGVGYHMVAEKAPGCDPSNVYSFLGKYVPGVEKESDVGAELTFRLPQESSPNFPS